ncbi:hypothetical protein [Nocardia macrotermitis]|uniref:Transposase n=1 Tax=Nocardia macrotermitis TaxID=2585198 RepID=A0A7K0DBQ0_9NOCA|nr:hypothetical protein [Nocardia macrotermitis]MQY23147.1 hypothetical protein [Nocardia macrotermitis]
MSVQVDKAWISSDQTAHQARFVGERGWVVSFLPGRTLTKVQALSAILIADSAAVALRLAPDVGLTALEAVGLVVLQPPWPRPAAHPYSTPIP